MALKLTFRYFVKNPYMSDIGTVFCHFSLWITQYDKSLFMLTHFLVVKYFDTAKQKEKSLLISFSQSIFLLNSVGL